jgi:hypothetical protein
MKRNLRWLVFAVAGVVLILVLVPLARRPQPPATLIVSACRDPVPTIQRVGSGNAAAISRVYFDVPERFSIHSGTPDMAIGTYHLVTLKDGSSNLEIGFGSLSLDRELNAAFPVFSVHVEERDVRTPGAASLARIVGVS